MKNIANLKVDNYYYVQIFLSQDNHGHKGKIDVLCFGNDIGLAKDIVNAWLDKICLRCRRNIVISRNNNKLRARKLMVDGDYLIMG